MIIQVRGTSGSGKTTVVKQVMKKLGPFHGVFIEGRKKPLYYSYAKNGYKGPNIFVLGHYEADCGGCDTIGSAPAVFDLIKEVHTGDSIILSEGLLWSEDVKWSVELLGTIDTNVRALFLTTSTEECLRRVTARQDGKKPLDPARVIRKLTTRVGTIERARLRLVHTDVLCKRCSSEQAPAVIKKWIA
jgi:shikimate kinase